MTEVAQETSVGDSLKELPTDIVFNSLDEVYNQIPNENVQHLEDNSDQKTENQSESTSISEEDSKIKSFLPTAQKNEISKQYKKNIKIPTGAVKLTAFPSRRARFPHTFEHALDRVATENAMFYLAFTKPASDVDFNPYEFRYASKFMIARIIFTFS